MDLRYGKVRAEFLAHESHKDFASYSLLFGKDSQPGSPFMNKGILILLAPSGKFIQAIQTISLIFVSWLNIYKTVRFEVLTAVNVKITPFWYVTPCS